MNITMKGFKGVSRDIGLAGLNLVVGPNGSGKSALADAIRYAALGYVPALGKRPADTAALMSGDCMAVTVQAAGRVWTRTLERAGKNLKAGADLGGCQGTATRQGEEIQQLFGASEQDVAECLDIRQLLAAPPAQRAARLEAMLATARGNATDAVARLAIMRLIEATEDRMPADWRDAVPMLADSHRDAIEDIGPLCAARVAEGLGIAQEWANKSKRAADVSLRNRHAAETELHARAAAAPRHDPERLRMCTAERDRLREELGAVRERHSAWQKARRTAAETETEIARALEAVASATRDVDAAGVLETDATAGMREELAELKKALDTQPTPQMPPLGAEATVLEREILNLRDILPAVPDYQSAERRIEYGRQRLATIEREVAAATNPWREVEEIADCIEKSIGATTQTTRLKALAGKHGGKSSLPRTNEKKLAEAELAEAIKDKHKAEAVIAKIDAINYEISKKREELDRLTDLSRADYRKAAVAYTQERARIIWRRDFIESEIRTRDAAAAEATTRLQQAIQRAGALRARREGMGAIADACPDGGAIEINLAAVYKDLDALTLAAARSGEIAALLAAIIREQAERDVYAAIDWACQRKREQDISAADGPLLRAMLEFLRAAGRQETPYIRAVQGVCALGWRRPDATEISIQALSGGEWCLFAAALTTAVTLTRTSTIKVVLVEAAEADAATLDALLAGIASTGKNITAAVVMTAHSPAPEAACGWERIEL